MKYAKDLDESLFNALHGKIAKKAQEYNNNYAQEKIKKYGSDYWNNYSEIIHNPWSDLLIGFCRNEHSEEDIKYCLLLGYVPETFHLNNVGRLGKMPKSQTKTKISLINLSDPFDY